MCFKKLVIKNSTKSYSSGNTRYKLKVPCSKCDDCQMQISKDWALRLWSEIAKYNKIGGAVAFVTFTYDMDNMPVFRYEQDGVKYCVPCFNKNHAKAYIKALRTDMYQKYGFTGSPDPKVKKNKQGKMVVSTVLPFKFMWASEYGKQFTQRPHYHCLFFLPPEFLATEEFKSEVLAKHYFRSHWKYGFTFFSKPTDDKGRPLGLYVRSEFAAYYVSKYCFKDWLFYNQKDIRDFLFDEDNKIIEERKEAIKDYLPHHLQSNGIGLDLCVPFDNFNSYLYGYDFQLKQNENKGKAVFSRMPRYIERKLLYHQTPDGRFILNDKGKQWKVDSLLPYVHDFAEKLFVDTSPLGIKKLVSDDFITKNFGEYHVHNCHELSSYITSILNGRSFKEVALYRFVWQGHFVEDTTYRRTLPIFDYLDSLSYLEFCSVSLDKYEKMLDVADNPDEFVEEGYFNQQSVNDRTHFFRYFSECKRFYLFDHILDIHDLLRAEYCHTCTLEYLKDRESRRKCKHSQFKSA